MNVPKPFWTIGREREKQHAASFVKKPDQQALLFPVIDAALDLNEGKGDEARFVDVARRAMAEGSSAVWEETSLWISKIALRYENVSSLWDELAVHPSWQARCRVACLLYHAIPEEQSDRLFAGLRHDRSAKVRTSAIDRYEYRPGPDGYIVKLFDSNDPASPGFSGS
ncbi:MAG TPA: hypothetical protein VFZ91_11865 [Allosphingosinicella sp.]